MNYTIEKMTNKLHIYEGNKLLSSLIGYAFMDEIGRCIIIVYGERKRDLVQKFLDGEIKIENK